MDIRSVLSKDELFEAKQHIHSTDDFGGMLRLALSGLEGLLADIDKVSNTKTFEILVASELDATFGCVGIGALSRECCELRGLYVVAPARRQGVGRALVTRATQWARIQGYHQVFLELPKTQMKYAMKLYEAVGFTVRSLQERAAPRLNLTGALAS